MNAKYEKEMQDCFPRADAFLVNFKQNFSTSKITALIGRDGWAPSEFSSIISYKINDQKY